MTADVGGMVDEALAESRDGNIITPRRARHHRRRGERAGAAAGHLLDRRRSHQLVNRVRGKLNRPARDAEVDFPSLEKVEGAEGPSR